MLNLDIGLRGMEIAQRALDVAGSNIANAGTAGYHKQEIVVSPLQFDTQQNIGKPNFDIVSTRRALDPLLEQQILAQQPQMGQVTQELSSLQTIEGAMGNVDSEGLGKSIDAFFSSMQQLATQPTSQPLQEQVVWSANAMTGYFHTIDTFVQNQTQQIRQQAATVVSQANDLIDQIANLNGQIGALNTRGGDSMALRDQRDQAITDLGSILEVKVEGNTEIDGVRDVTAWGTPLVVADHCLQLETGQTADGQLGVSVKGASFYHSDLTGGQLGALLNLQNNILPGIQTNMDTLASQVISSVNQLHAQGVGSQGGFSEIQSLPVNSETLSTWPNAVTAGQFYIRVTDAAGNITRTPAITVDPATDTVQTMATKITAAGVNAWVENSSLHIAAPPGGKIDFSPALTPTPASSTLSIGAGWSAPTISGLYAGATNQDYTFTVLSSGAVGNGSLSLQVSSPAGTVATVNVGAGYAAGDVIDAGDGIKLSMSAGNLTAGQTFTVKALANSDTSGFLAAAGVNTFFGGYSASTINVADRVKNDPTLIAGALGADGTDNANVSRMAALGQTPLAALGNVSIGENFRQMVSNLGQEVTSRQARQTALQNVQTQLTNQQQQISGVDVNDETAKLLIFERLFQASAKVVQTQDKSMQTLMDIL